MPFILGVIVGELLMLLVVRWRDVYYRNAEGTLVWIRLGRHGPGLLFKHRSMAPLFTERYGHRRFWPAWPRTRWRVGVLRPWR
jgi:hypothetical protein